MSWSRRRFLQVGAGALALPALPGRALGAGSAPKRMLLVHVPQGTVLSQWVPTGSDIDFQLPYITEPLDRHRDSLILLSGIDNRAPRWNVVGNAHFNANYTFLTGRPFAEQVESGLSAGGPSIEQVIADRIGGDAAFPRLDFTVGGPETSDGILTLGEGSTMWHGVHDPVAAMLRIFGDQSLSPADAWALRARRASVLDGVLGTMSSMRRRLGTDARLRLEAHEQRLVELESRIVAGIGSSTPPDLDPPPGYRYGLDEPTSAALFTELITAAFSCDLTRLATLSFANSDSPTFPWLTAANGGVPIVQPGVWDNWHAMVHADYQTGMEVAYRWYHEVLADLLDALAAGTDADGDNMLQTTLVVCVSEYSSGRHWHNALPVVLAGCVGAAPTGRHLNFLSSTVADFEASHGYQQSLATTNQLWTSVLHAFGFDDETFGFVDPDLPNGPLPGLG